MSAVPRTLNSRLEGYRNKTPGQRLEALAEAVGLAGEDAATIGDAAALDVARANGMIENVVGTFQLPMGIATNFTINGRDYLIPMVVEEPSVVAAASYMARIAREHGGFQTSSTDPVMRAQVQVLGITDPHGARLKILAAREQILEIANSRDAFLVKLGGGCKDIEVHVFPDTRRGAMVVLHLLVDVRDAMGANAVNTMAEAVAPLIEELTGGRVRLRILSNLADRRLARAQVRVPQDALATKEFSGERMVEGILDAHELAVIDPYRAATHNKGIMNGIDPVVIATGNDWRAVEAGAHAYSVRNGQYTSMTKWWQDEQGNLHGSIELPMALGIVGGATRVHPTAQLALRLLKVKSARELAEVVVTVGLAQNFAAIRALATSGIQKGHMRLHAKQLAVAAGADGDLIERVVQTMIDENNIRLERAKQLVEVFRSKR